MSVLTHNEESDTGCRKYDNLLYLKRLYTTICLRSNKVHVLHPWKVLIDNQRVAVPERLA